MQSFYWVLAMTGYTFLVLIIKFNLILNLNQNPSCKIYNIHQGRGIIIEDMERNYGRAMFVEQRVY